MGFWDLDDGKVIFQRVGGRGRSERRSFGIVRHKQNQTQPKLVIPAMSGAQPGQKVRYKLVEGGVAFRIADEGEYTVFSPQASSKAMMAMLPDELAKFAGPRVKDIITQPYQGGWFAPFDQFK